MGLLDGLGGQLLGGLMGGGGQQNPMLGALMNMLGGAQGAGQQGAAGGLGGLGGLLSALQSGGLGDQVKSWVGSGPNAPVSADQVKSALGQDKLAELAQAAGVSHDEAAGHLANLLPQLVDHLTPNGAVPDNNALGQMLSMLKGKLAG